MELARSSSDGKYANATTSEAATTEAQHAVLIPFLPGDILLEIFPYLSFKELLDCTRISRYWEMLLLHGYSPQKEALFLKSRRTTEDTPEIAIMFQVERVPMPGSPSSWSIEVASCACLPPDDYGDDDESNINFHPVLKNLHKNLDLVNEAFIPSGAPPGGRCLTFNSIQDLVRKTASPRGTFDGEGWEKMLACVPKARQISIGCKWLSAIEYPNSLVVNPDGVTLLDVVQEMRSILQDADLAVRELRLTRSVDIM